MEYNRFMMGTLVGKSISLEKSKLVLNQDKT